MHPRHFLRSAKDVYQRYGWTALAEFLFNSALNLFCYNECLHIIVLPRAALRPLDAEASQAFSSRIATESELLALSADPDWQINDTKLGFFRAGDRCVLSCVDGKVAGYTWVHTDGRPEIMPGLTLSIPQGYLYNYAGLTHRAFRGAGLQSYRHRSVLDNERWLDCKALIGYVSATNFASRRGQSKSGYERIGSVWLIGTRKRFLALFSRRLRDLGIGRI